MADAWIIGAGIVCGAGCSPDQVWAAMQSGATAIGPAQRFSVPDGRNNWVASTSIEPGLRHSAAPDSSAAQLCLAMARAAAQQALVGADARRRATTALVWASNVEDHHALMHEFAGELADGLGLGGPRFGVSVACASATLAVGIAARLITRGDASRVLVVASDVITPRVIAGFEQLGLLADRPCVPFSPLIGTSLGEGAAALLLDVGAGVGAGAGALRVSGWGSSNDAHHPTQPHPGGEGVARALVSALTLARCDPASVEHVSAHGTGTAANDGAEWSGLSRALGRVNVPVSAIKSLVGHTQGACGLVELVASMIALEHDTHPPTVGFTQPRASAPPDVVGPRPRAGGPRTLVSVNAGFGGSNAAVVVTRGHVVQAPELARREVYICGVGCMDPDRAASLDPCRAVRGVDLRGHEAQRLALCVALADARVAGNQRASRRDPTGLFVGQARVSTAQTQRLAIEYSHAGLYGASANVFTQTFLGHAGSAAAAALGLRGPFGVSTEGRCAGLVALVHAVESIREGAAQTMLAGEVWGDLERAYAIGLALAGAPGTGPSGGRAVRVVAHGFGPAGDGALARGVALERAGWDAASLGAGLFGSGLGSDQADPLSQRAVVRAFAAIQRGEIERALVWDQQAGALSCAIVLAAHDR
jgi:3-oxoacyl-[acyl-carrier-protein] synthase II